MEVPSATLELPQPLSHRRDGREYTPLPLVEIPTDPFPPLQDSRADAIFVGFVPNNLAEGSYLTFNPLLAAEELAVCLFRDGSRSHGSTIMVSRTVRTYNRITRAVSVAGIRRVTKILGIDFQPSSWSHLKTRFGIIVRAELRTTPKRSSR
ncbi:hypothetical protein HYW67_02850 [Candidatus Parcubacteria bacterium]|nr:hypothetical protein [Candidatus Parcubacteria bacterium]